MCDGCDLYMDSAIPFMTAAAPFATMSCIGRKEYVIVKGIAEPLYKSQPLQYVFGNEKMASSLRAAPDYMHTQTAITVLNLGMHALFFFFVQDSHASE